MSLSVLFIFAITCSFFAMASKVENRKTKMLQNFKEEWTRLDRKHED